MHIARLALLAVIVTAAASPVAPQTGSRFDDYFTDKTMRVDYFHTGGLGTEVVALDRVVSDGVWPGSRTRFLDDTNRGKYFFEVIDTLTNRAIYSRGFSSLYGEWETTAEPRRVHRTFHESLRFPWPKVPVQIALKKRNRGTPFREIWSTTVDSSSRFVNRADAKPIGRVWGVFENGAPAEKVDLVVLGDGYTEREIPKFHADVKRLVDALFAREPFKSRKTEFNVRAIDLPAEESGVNRPQAGAFRRTPLSAEFNIFDTERYMLTYDNRRLRDVAAAAPYEFLEILANERAYGGGGIFGFQATASVDAAYSEYVFIHEFGHHFADLADEYYTSAVAYETGGTEHEEPWEPNITATIDRQRLKWRELVGAPTPIPTPWDKETYDRVSGELQAKRRALIARNAPQSEIDALFRAEEEWSTKLLSSMKYFGKVGAFEGAGYEARGLHRPELDCIMFTRNKVPFCRVCLQGIERIIDLYAKP